MIYHFLNNISWAEAAVLRLRHNKRGSQRNSFGSTHTHPTCAHTHTLAQTYTGCGNLAVLFCFFSVRLWKTTARFEQEARAVTAAQTCDAPRYGLSLIHFQPEFGSTDRTHAALLCVAVYSRGRHVYHGQTGEAEDEWGLGVRGVGGWGVGGLINNKCHPASPVLHICVAFTLHLRLDARMKRQPAKRLQVTPQQKREA